jgi:alcohol dehydrogenase class IV
VTPPVICAHGALDELPKVLARRRPRHIFLVTGKKAYSRSGAQAALTPYLAPYTVTRWSDFEENPKLQHLERGLARFHQAQPDLILAVGGGSAMDMAKLIKIFSIQSKPPSAYIEGDELLAPATLPLVAIPTTAGSGSQATHFAVLYIGRSKHSVAHACMRPDVALVDPALLQSVSPSIAAATGLDALNQGIESYWSIRSTETSKNFARQAIELVCANLRDIVCRPSDATRLAMAHAAHRAGEAINITTTTAPHAISYPITSYFGVPHGHAVGLVLARILAYNEEVQDQDCLDPRGADYVRATMREIASLLGATDAASAAARYNALMDDISLSRDFSSLGIATDEDIEILVTHGFNPQRVRNNPRLVTEDALRNMLRELQRNPAPCSSRSLRAT